MSWANLEERQRRALYYEIAERTVVEILDKGLADSTWREEFPEAYNELLQYRQDLEGSVVEVLEDSE